LRQLGIVGVPVLVDDVVVDKSSNNSLRMHCSLLSSSDVEEEEEDADGCELMDIPELAEVDEVA